jgi:hypothetical protein
MKFAIVDPSVLTVYESTLRLNDLGEILDGYEEENIEVPEEFRLKIEDSAIMFVMAEKKAMDILGSRDMLNDQLELLQDRRGIS